MKSEKIFACYYVVSWVQENGWRTNYSSPTFFIHEGPQGCTDEETAEGIVRRMAEGTAREGSEISVNVCKVGVW